LQDFVRVLGCDASVAQCPGGVANAGVILSEKTATDDFWEGCCVLEMNMNC